MDACAYKLAMQRLIKRTKRWFNAVDIFQIFLTDNNNWESFMLDVAKRTALGSGALLILPLIVWVSGWAWRSRQ